MQSIYRLIGASCFWMPADGLASDFGDQNPEPVVFLTTPPSRRLGAAPPAEQVDAERGRGADGKLQRAGRDGRLLLLLLRGRPGDAGPTRPVQPGGRPAALQRWRRAPGPLRLHRDARAWIHQVQQEQHRHGLRQG